MAPYTHCKIPLRKVHYLAGGLLPGILMGILPAIYGLVTGQVQVLFWGIIYTWTAAGDFISCWYILKEPAGTMILDHPEELGYYVMRNPADRKR